VKHPAECGVHRAGGDSTIVQGEKDVIVHRGRPLPYIEVRTERHDSRGVQGHEAGFSKLRMPYAQDPIGQDVTEPEFEGLGHPQSRGSNEPEQRRVYLPSQRVRSSKAAGRLDDLLHLLGLVDVRHGADLGAAEQIRWHDFVDRVLGVEEARHVSHVPQSNVPRIRGAGLSSPCHGCGRADVGVAVRSREGGERAKLFRGVVKCEAERLPEADVAFNLIGQHDETSGHGCAISERRPKSTLA
jgi:hypothetical protein